MSAPEAILCILAGVIVLPLAFVPFLVEAGEKAGIVKTGQSGDDR
jgi:hypothetical protein